MTAAILERTMIGESATKIKWQLTQTAFDKLLASLSGDRSEAGEKYLLLRRNLVRFFETRGFSAAEDAADEVCNRLARKLDEGGQFENVNTYALGVARFLWLELRKSPAAKTSSELPEIGVWAFDDEKIENEQKLGCLEKCLQELSPENRQIIVGYYEGEKRDKIENRQKLAEDLGVPQNALRNRAVRLRDKLESCILACLRGKKH